MLDKLLQRLPDTYEKSPDSNVGKLLTLPAEQLDDIEENLDRLQDWRDIDKAEGKVLDRIGRNVNISRRGMSDREFRTMIKIQIISNLSPGDIETINQVAPVLLHGEFVGVEEGWLFDSNILNQEPASLLLKVNADIEGVNPMPFNPIERIVAGGVRVYWELRYNTNVQIFTDTDYTFLERDTEDCGTFNAGQELIFHA